MYDLGGGTFDISALEIGDGVFQVAATNGDTHLGGDDWDNRLMDWIIGEFKKDTSIDLSKQPDAVQRIKEESEKAKIALSSTQEYEINLPFVTADQTGPKHIQKKLTRSKLEQLTDDLFERTVKPVKDCLNDAKWSANIIDELVLVGGMTRMPKVVDTARSLIGKEPHKGVNPDEVVAVGAAIQGGVLKGDVKDVLLLDVTPLTLAIETAGGIATGMIPRNTTIPTRKSQIFSTYSDSQPGVEIKVLQGERPLSRDNKQLGTFHLDGIPPAPRGVPQIEVTFDIDANGILNVSAKDLGTSKEQKISITGSSGLTKDEVDRMQREAESHADEDRKAKEGIELRNNADNLAYQAEKQLKELGDKVDGATKKSARRRDRRSARVAQGQRQRRGQEVLRWLAGEVPRGQCRALQESLRADRSAARTLRRPVPPEPRRRTPTSWTPSSRWSTRTRRRADRNLLTTVRASAFAVVGINVKNQPTQTKTPTALWPM